MYLYDELNNSQINARITDKTVELIAQLHNI